MAELNGVTIYDTDESGQRCGSCAWNLKRYTVVPDYFLDTYMADLSGTEVRVMLYIYRRTLGFQKVGDPISYNQFLNGIVTRDGRRLDDGCGVRSRSTLNAALKRLEEKKLIKAYRREHANGDNDVTFYRMHPERFRPIVPEDN